MPNRIVRADILTSERVNALSFEAECFYRRLMNVVDDYGRFSANFTLLRSSCFPLRVDSVKEEDISEWIKEICDVGLLMLYSVDCKDYLEIDNFGQQKRSKSKFPDPLDYSHSDENDPACEQMLSDDSKCSPSRSRIRSRSRGESGDSPTAKNGMVREMTDAEFLDDLVARKAYEGIDVQREVDKCRAWCDTNHKTCSRHRIVNWLNRVERPFNAEASVKPQGAAGRKLEVVKLTKEEVEQERQRQLKRKGSK